MTTSTSNCLKRLTVADLSDVTTIESAISTWEPSIPLHRLVAQDLSTSRCHQFKAVLSTDDKLVNQGDSFAYKNNDQVNEVFLVLIALDPIGSAHMDHKVKSGKE